MAGIVSKDIYRLVKTTTTEIDIMDRIYHGDVDAYNIDIEFYGVTSISGTCNLHFVLPDGTALDKDDSDGVVIDGNNVKYTLPTYLYQQSGNLTMYVQFMNSNIYTPLKVNFKNIVAIPDGGEEVVATTTYPVWYDDAKTDETAREAAEVIRESNEDARIAAETLRVTAEDSRATWEEFNALTVYAVGNKVYYPTTGSSYILHTASGIANTLPTDTDYWQIIVEKGASGIIDEFSSTNIIGVLAGNGTNITTASADDLPYVNTTSGLVATDTQVAIDELASEKEDKTSIGNRTYTEQNYVTNGETITESLDVLDVSLNAAFDAIDIAMVNLSYGGWISADETWTYASASTFTVSGDVTDKYQKGDKIKWTQETVKYGHIESLSYSSPNTTVTIIANTDYVVANSPITENFFSKSSNPQGFPHWFNWDATTTGTTAEITPAYYKYNIDNGICYVNIKQTSPGTSNSASFTVSLPTVCNIESGFDVIGYGVIMNNTIQTTPGVLVISWSTPSIVAIYSNFAFAGFTTSGSKRLAYGIIDYPV